VTLSFSGVAYPLRSCFLQRVGHYYGDTSEGSTDWEDDSQYDFKSSPSECQGTDGIWYEDTWNITVTVKPDPLDNSNGVGQWLADFGNLFKQLNPFQVSGGNRSGSGANGQALTDPCTAASYRAGQAYQQASGAGLTVAQQGKPSIDWAAYSSASTLFRQALQGKISPGAILGSALIGSATKASYYLLKGIVVQTVANAKAIKADLNARIACGESINPIPDFSQPPDHP